MNRPLLRAPRALLRRPYRARRATIVHTPVVLDVVETRAPIAVVVVAIGVLGASMVVLAVVGLAVIA